MKLEDFTEVLKLAVKAFGTLSEANQWLYRPAMGLNQQKPIELMATEEGVQQVKDFLGRLEYNAYT
jgi:putative toxin-antitoxin system antitoxin component (TIGR02293 family)